jgi:hypothetical protein
LIGPGFVAPQAAPDDGLTLVDQLAVPELAVLIGQQDEVPARADAGGSPGLDQQHEGEQSHDLRLVGHELGEEAAQADRFRA